jgi:cytochrome c oxidase subunit II
MVRFLAFLTSVFVFRTAPAFAWPTDIWGIDLVEAASPIKHRVHDFHGLLMIIITAITIFVVTLLLYTVWRYRRGKNPVPSTTTHNVAIEIVWTLIPCAILAVIMFFSFPLMYYMEKTNTPDLTLKVTGYQWYWGYSYPDQAIDEFTLNVIPDSAKRDPKNEAQALRDLPTYQRLLSTYDQVSGKPAFVVLPVDKNVRVLMTAGDVLHAWAVPALGVKKDAVPGRTNETWLRIDTPGIYYGQCSELCGIDHGFMPIEIRAVTQEQFDAWAETMKTDPQAAMASIQDQTQQFARQQIHAPHLTIPMALTQIKEKFGFAK